MSTNPHLESWTEYRKLVIESLKDLKVDLKALEVRITSLEKYSDIHDDFKKLKSDFDKFMLSYEREIRPIEAKQKTTVAIASAVLGAALTAAVHYFIG